MSFSALCLAADALPSYQDDFFRSLLERPFSTFEEKAPAHAHAEAFLESSGYPTHRAFCDEWVPVNFRASYATFTKIITSVNNTSDSMKAKPRISAT